MELPSEQLLVLFWVLFFTPLHNALAMEYSDTIMQRFPILYPTPVAGVSIGIAITLGRIVGDYAAKNK